VILSFIFFMILFLGGIWLMGLAQSLPDEYAAYVFVAGLLIVSLSLAFMMRARGSATRRKDNWSGSPTE
jgi:cytochrome c biogenesis protein CcdA